jgi:serine/threonine protein kinase
LCGFPPFYDEDNMALFDKIKKGVYDFPSPSWDNISPDAINIIKALLVVDPSKRMTPDELLKHPWVQGETTTKKGGDVLKKMREWNSKRKING